MKAIDLPLFDNSDLSSATAWYQKNTKTMLQYLHWLGWSEHNPEDEDLTTLVKIQYDRQVMLDRLNSELQLTYQNFELQLTYQLAQVSQ